jgi:Na+/alanine symporter
MILGMAFPNILGLILLSEKVKKDLNNYKILKETKQKNLTSSF